MFTYLLFCWMAIHICQSIGTPYIQTCIPSQPCDNEIQCPPDKTQYCQDEGFIVNCTGPSICQSRTVICPESESAICSIICHGNSSCSSVTIHATDTYQLEIISIGVNALSNSNIHTSSTIITITHYGDEYENGNGDGLNNMNIKSVNDFSSINVYCMDLNSVTKHTCWGSETPPKLYFGHNYESECTIINTDECVPIQPLHASQSIPTTSTQDTTSSRAPSTKHTAYGIDNAILLIIMGMVCGVLLSICMCLVLCVYHSNKQGTKKLSLSGVKIPSNSLPKAQDRHSMDTIPPGDDNLTLEDISTTKGPGHGSLDLMLKAKLKRIRSAPPFVGRDQKLSPSLKKLSPQLTPQMPDFIGLSPQPTESINIETAQSFQSGMNMNMNMNVNMIMITNYRQRILKFLKRKAYIKCASNC